MNNTKWYYDDREKRWSMAKKEPEAIAAICRILERMSGHKVEYRRYDKIWFDKFAPDLQENEWVRGASDYVIRIDDEKYVYAEIKLKSVKFKKTKTGGITKKGSAVTNYGCESFYLDIEPVYKNMCAFVEKAKIESWNFIIFFIDETLSEVHAISLAEIQDLERNGFRGQELCIFTEGYGTRTKDGPARDYLIPVQATTDLNFNYIEQHCAPSIVTELPEMQTYYYAGTMFYHCHRDCKYIVHKSDEIVQEICREDIINNRLIPCRECCRQALERTH